MTGPEWRDIRGYEGRYQVSSDGHVRNAKGQILKPNMRTKRYYSVRLYGSGGEFENRLIHRLVAETFLDYLGEAYEVNHIDGNRYNNDVSNLEWVTHSENMKHAVTHDLVSTEKAKAAHRKPVKCSNGKTYPSTTAASEELGVLPSCISAVLRGRYKTTGGYTFSFC